MSAQVMMLVGRPPDWADTLVELIGQEPYVDCMPVETLADARQFLDIILPDLILVYAEGLVDSDSPDGELLTKEAAEPQVVDFCKNLRQSPNLSTEKHRPIIIIHSENTTEQTRLRYMIEGADDTLNQAMSVEELRVRLLVQIRRNLEMLSHPTTRLPNLDIANRVLQRWINLYGIEPERTWALGLIRIDNLNVYEEVYGEMATGQVLGTITQLLAGLVHPPDFLGHATETNTLIMITPAKKVERVAQLLCRQFEEAAPQFYSATDRKRGYLIAQNDYRVSRRVPLMSLSLGLVHHAGQAYNNYKQAFAEATHLAGLAQRSIGNTWISETAKLAGGTEESPAVASAKTVPHVLVVEPDDALAFLLQSTLEMQGFTVDWAQNAPKALECAAAKAPTLVLMDVVLETENTHDGTEGWQLCQTLKTLHPNTTVIMLATIHDRHKAMQSGADIYLPKPFELIALLNTVDQLTNG